MILIFSAPSGSGKSTMVEYLLQQRNDLEFSISATTRPPRGREEHGKEYYFLSVDEFRRLIDEDAFVEWENVYRDTYYCTLKSEMARIESAGHHAVFDIDVKGGVNMERLFGDKALSVFIAPPSIEELRKRLVKRGTDSAEMIEERVQKAAEEMEYARYFDKVIINNDLETAKKELLSLVQSFLPPLPNGREFPA